jgi:dephospho-CoA kinase
MRTLLQAASSPYCIAVIPLLVETGQADLVDRTLVVDIPESLQRLRVAARDGLSDNDITDILSSQADRSTRLAAADEVINNEGDRALLRAQVDKLHAYYLTLAQ